MHLEIRDVYATSIERDRFNSWLHGEWPFDGETVAFTHFSGDGLVLDHEITTDAAVVRTCKAAFEAAWDIAIRHHEFKPA